MINLTIDKSLAGTIYCGFNYHLKSIKMTYISEHNNIEAESLQGQKVKKNARIIGKTLEIKHISGDRWDEVISSFDGACQEQLYVFSKNRWPNVALEPVLFFNNGEITGGALVLVQALPLKLGHIAILKWGPLLKDHGADDKDEIYAACVEALLEEYDKKRKMMVSILPRASHAKNNAEFEYLMKRGFNKGSQLKFPNRYFVNLRQNDEEIRKSFAQKWRYHLNKSMKADLHFEHAKPERIDEFKSLYEQMNDRKKFADHSAYEDTIDELMAIKDKSLRPELFFVREGAKIVAGAIIFKAGETAVYLYGATSHEALKLRAGYFIHYQIIRWLRDNNSAKYYDLGGTDGFQGLHQFKKGMVGSAGVIAPVPAVANYASHTLPLIMGSLAFFARDRLLNFKHYISGFLSNLAKPDQKREER